MQRILFVVQRELHVSALYLYALSVFFVLHYSWLYINY